MSTILEQSSGKFVPPGTTLDEFSDVRNILLCVSSFFLLLALCGWAAAIRRSLRFASAFFLLCLIDTVSSFALVSVSVSYYRDFHTNKHWVSFPCYLQVLSCLGTDLRYG